MAMEKHASESKHASRSGSSSSSGTSDDPQAEFSPAEQRAIIRRIDRRLVLTVGLMYCVSLMDRTNLSAANIAGMSAELEMETGYRYSIVTLVFFITYVLFQPPSTVIVRALGPRAHLAGICILWGALMVGMGFVKTWDVMAGLRVLLGVLEAGFFPSAVYLLSTWYSRYDVGKRYSVFYIIGLLASGFSGILAYGLMQMDGLAGLGGWRWIFIIEGIITCLLGLGGYWLLVDFPDGTHKSWAFLTPRETQFVLDRVNADRGDASTHPFTLSRFLAGGRDWRIWGYAMIYFGSTTMAYALAYFLPVILVRNMRFGVGAAQCLVAPPYAFAALVALATGWAGDRWRVRGPLVVANTLLCAVGLPMMGFAKGAGARYFGVFLVTAGANANVPATLAYQMNNVRGNWKRAFTSATLVGFGGIGGVAGSLVFRSQDAPYYRPGIWACIACVVMNLAIVGVLSLSFWRANKKAARGELVIEGDADDEGAKDFRYTY